MLFHGAGSSDPIFPLSISGDGRWLLKKDGTPFNINGETPWELATNLTKANVTTYLADRAARGINTVLWEMIEHLFTDQTPKWKNKNGDVPFSGTVSSELDFTTPVEAYWAHVDWVVRECKKFGMLCLVTPAYLGFSMGTEGWASAVAANGTARMTTYGTFLGERYRWFKNIIWVMGGDTPPNTPTNLTTHVNNLANAIKAAHPGALITAHSDVGHSSFDDYNQSWLDINASYAIKTAVHLEVRTSRQQATKPTFLIEGNYGNENSISALDLRTEMYQAVLGGGCGNMYGQSPMWYFGVDASASGNAFADTGGLDWHNTLASFQSDVLIYVRRLQNARNISTLSPDYAHTKVTAGYDSGGTEGVTYCPVQASTQILVAYTRGAALTVNKATFVSATFKVNWFNVRDGSTTSGGTSSFGSGSQVFTPPDGNDWVLLLDDQALGLTNP